MYSVEEAIRERVLCRLDMEYDYQDDEIREIIKDEICIAGRRKTIGIKQRLDIENHVFNALRKFDVLEDLLKDETITEIMINGPQNVFIEKNGVIEKANIAFASEEKLNDIIQSIVASKNKIVNETSPIVDTRLNDGSRVNIVLPPAAVDYPILSIRKFPKEKMSMKKLLELESISEEIAEFIEKMVISGMNIFVSGGTGSGKTSFINAVGEYIPKDQRVVTIEDSAEIQLKNVENLVRLEARSANLEGKNEISIRELLKSSLRMRPDRIIVGECRGAEALEMLQAFNTGHDGSLSTGHANSCEDMLLRLETMVLMGSEMPISAIRQQIAAGIDIIVHLGRLRDKSRKVLEIVEVDGIKDKKVSLNILYQFCETEVINGKIKGVWVKKNNLKHLQKIENAGIKL